MRWKVLKDLIFEKTLPAGRQENTSAALVALLLENRGITDTETFLHPSLDVLTPEHVHIDPEQLERATKRIEAAIKSNGTMVVYGDYDVDGVTGTAILWEALHDLGANVHPYIPHRVEEGYGLSLAGIDNLTKQFPECSLIITVDNGIMAHEAVQRANSLGIDVIITDHHELPEEMPEAYAIVHTNDICGAAVGWMLTKNVILERSDRIPAKAEKNLSLREGSYQGLQPFQDDMKYFDLLTLSTVADLMPLTGANRAIVTFGLPELRGTTRLGLQALFAESGIEDPSTIGVYEIGHVIAPRLNAMGRLESAMDSLRLLCTKNGNRAQDLAHLLGETNRGRQLLMQAAAMQAVEEVKRIGDKKKIIVHVGDYEEGIIGLVAGRLVEAFYKPAIVITKKSGVSKASARSVHGFDIIAFIRKHSDLLLNAGGHPMAAGFSLSPERIEELQTAMELLAETEVLDVYLERELKIDCTLPLSLVNQTTYEAIQTLSPFGIGNPEPVFMSDAKVDDIRLIGKDKTHVKMQLEGIDAIGFSMADKCKRIKVGDTITIAYTIQENVWNGRKNLQLVLKDIQI